MANSTTKSHSAGGGDLADHPAGDGSRIDALGAVDGAGGELRVEQLAVLDVLGRVDLGRDEAVRRVGFPGRERLAGEEVDVLVQLLDRVVAGDDPVALGVGVEERRRLLAQRGGLGPVPAGLLVVEHGELLDRAPADVAGHRARIDRVIQQTDHFPSRTHVSRRPTDPLSAPAEHYSS